MSGAVKTAKDMPAGTEVASFVNRWTKNRPGDPHPWTDRFGRVYTDEQVDARLRHGAILDHVPTGPGRWPTTHMVIGAVINYDDEWAQQQIDGGATVTYPEVAR